LEVLLLDERGLKHYCKEGEGFMHILMIAPEQIPVLGGGSVEISMLSIANELAKHHKITIISRRFSGCKHMSSLGNLTIVRVSSGSSSKYKNKYNLQDAFTILFSGRIIPRKGVSVLIKTTYQVRNYLPQAKLVIVGSGKPAYIKKLRLQAKKWKVPVLFTGRIAHNKIHKIYRIADCFVCPSQRYEAFGLVNVEAMATGIPVVASDIGGIKEIIRHGENGYIIKNYKNPFEFAQYIMNIVQDKKLAENLGKQGRLIAVNQFGWNLTANKIASIYKNKAVINS
jgi:spore coat protein SA